MMIDVKKILAVDDNPDILEVLNELLQMEGYEVIMLSEGSGIFETIQKTDPDLILLDVMLADMDGREICHAIKDNKSTHDIPVILISASHNLENSLNEEGSADDFVAKPFDINFLLDRISRQLAA